MFSLTKKESLGGGPGCEETDSLGESVDSDVRVTSADEVQLKLPEGQHLTDLMPGNYFGQLAI